MPKFSYTLTVTDSEKQKEAGTVTNFSEWSFFSFNLFLLHL